MAVLILTRLVGERVLVGSAWVTVLDIRSHKVRLGIEAPADVPIAREEVQRRLDGGEAPRNRHLA